MIDLLLGVIAIAALFAIRKYLMSSDEKSISLSRVYNSRTSNKDVLTSVEKQDTELINS